MKRRLLNLLTPMSLLLSPDVTVVAVRSDWNHDVIIVRWAGRLASGNAACARSAGPAAMRPH